MEIRKYLGEQLKGRKGLGPLLNSFTLRYLDADRFQEEFGEMTPEEMVEFIINPDNAYKIGQWSYRQRNPATREGWLKAKGNIQRETGDRF